MANNKKKHVTKEERFCIDKLLKQHKTFTEIAITLGRGLSTISEEVSSNGGREQYDAKKAHRRAYWKQYRKKRTSKKVALDSHLSTFVEKALSRGWSPETISARLKKQSGLAYASPKAIRKYTTSRGSLERFLFWHRNKKKSGPKRGKGSYLADTGKKSIDMRPMSAIYGYGHWEGDFIVSLHNAWVLLVLVERHSRQVKIRRITNRNNGLVNETVVQMLQGFVVKTLTLDNDIAFGKWRQLETLLNAQIYFCHPYHSWEKGLVENTNRWIRQFVPKRSDIGAYADSYIAWVEDWFNHTPRQCLHGSTSYEIIMEKEFGKFVNSQEINLPKLRIWG